MQLLILFFSKLFEPFTDDCGRLSSMRFMTFIVVCVGAYLFYEVIAVWKAVCLAKQEFLPLNFTDFTGLLGAVAALFAKGWQSSIESKNSRCVTPAAPSKIVTPRRRPQGATPSEEGEQ